MAATDNIRVAIRVRPLIKRENDFHQPIHWKVDGNTITQLANGKILPNSSYFFDRIFDMSSSTQDVYDEFGRPTVLSAMDGFNGTLFAYGQTSSGKTHTMMGDGNCQGVIPKAIGEIFDYIEKNPSREFLIRVSYIEIYNEDIKDLLNPARTNLKIHENAEKQVYVGELTEEVVSCSEDVFKHMMRGEKNRHFGVTNMNDRSSRSHTIFRVVIESREMMDESKAPDTIDGAVRVAHLNLVDLAGSERASQTGAFGQRLKEGGHINKSLLALGSVIAKLSEGESFIPFRDSKLTRILQSSLGGNAKTSMLCTITPAAIEESISTLKFASRAKTIKNCPEVNEVLDDGTLLKRYRKEIRELKQQLVQVRRMSSSSHVQELQLEKEKMEEMLEQQRRQQNEQEEKIKRLCNMICTAGGETANNRSKAKLTKRRETWCPGAGLSKAPLATSAAFSSVKSRLQRIPSSPSSDESEFGEMTKDIFLSTLEEEEDIKSSESGKKRVVFASPAGKRCLSSTTDLKKQEHKEMQTEPDQNCMEMEREVKRLRSDLHEAIETRDFYNELLEESNALLEKMSTENGRNDTPTTQVSMLKTLDQLRAKNKELQAEFDSVQAEKESLAARVEGLENAGTFNTAAQMNADSLQMALDEGVQERDRLCENLKEWQKKCTCRESDVARLQGKITNAGQEGEQYSCQQEASERIRQLELQVKEMGERLSGVKEQERRLTEAIEEKVQLEESKKLEVACLEEALDEMTKEKGRLDETLQLWKDKCAILETIVALSKEEKPSLEEKMASAREEASVKIKKLEEQVKEMEDRLKSVDGQEGMLTEVIEQKLQLEENHKVEVTSLKKTLASLEGALDEVTKEKGRLDEALQQWKDKCASLETNEALSKEEKLCLEEKMAFVGEEASEKIRKLEEQVKEMEERLANVDEQEGMLTEVIEQKLQLEENHKVEVTSLKKALEEIAQEKESIESWKEKCASLESDLRRLQEEITCVERERERSKLEESLSIVKEDTSVKMKEMGKGKLSNEDENKIMLAEVTEQRVNLEDIVTPLETDAAQGKELSEQTRNIKACFEQFKEEKDEEIMQLKKDIQELQDERNITSCGVEEKDTLLEQIIEQKQELEAKMSDLQVQLENVINEKEEYEQLLIQVKKEKDEIKNDLSESISDSAELQKDMLEMQQKVKRYKEHIYELENELRLRAELITSHEQKCEELQNRLSEALKQLQNVSQDMNKKLLSEGQVPDEQHEKETDADDEKFTSELSAEKERAQEIADECNALKLSLENVQNRNGILESEVEETKQEVEKKLKQLKSLELQLVESKQAYDLCEEQLKEQRDKCEELVKELNEMKSTECQSKKLSGSFSSELELHKAKRENEELLKELGEEKKTHEMLRKEHTSVLEELQHFKDSLLRDTNRGMDQQRLIDKMKAERRETICVQAQQRHELENDLCEAQKKVSELETQCNFLRSERDVLEHRIEVANKKVEETKQEMRDMENLYSSHNVLSVTQRDDDSKVVQKLKQMELNVELTKQKCEKAEGRVKELESENRQLKGADIRNGALAEERDSLKQQVQQSKQVLSEKNKKVNELSIEVTQLKAHVDKLTDESKRSRSQLEKKDNMVDQMEQKLWEIEEELKIERQRCQEHQMQDSTVEELNSTIRVKHEELEHMTFLLDEKEVEIAEVTTTLQQKELKQSEMTEESRRNEGKINELEKELEYVNESLLEVKKSRVEAEAKIGELKGIIRQQEAELISVNKKMETLNGENESQSQELALKTEQFEKELEDMQHRLLEVESELEFTKSSLENVDAEKKDLNTRVEKALKEKELFDEKLYELTASFDNQKNALDQEIDEIRESLLKEKNIVSELEDKLLVAEKSRDAAELEVRRVLADQCASVSKEEMNSKISAIMNSENELRQELEMEKGKSAKLMEQVEKLTTEKEKWESLAQSKTALLEEENKWVEEIACMTELRQELEKEIKLRTND
ncbi:kinesin-like protein KIN-7I [Stylophora pistillata]|uniref:kinesin-like protein KIN-7I n=1 Tax=Stylophora pistillata TaxID=50429 RepID=UPI000C04C45C|nr:kinesin-like protein KIN-7I [Stylophora pistillata]